MKTSASPHKKFSLGEEVFYFKNLQRINLMLVKFVFLQVTLHSVSSATESYDNH